MSDKGSAIFLVGSIAGVLVAFGGSVPYLSTCFQCLIPLVAGGAAVWYYTQDRSAGVSGGTGAGIGAGAGAVAVLVNGAIGAVLMMAGLRPGWDETKRDVLQRMQEVGGPEQQIEMWRQMLESGWFPAAIMGCGLVLYATLGAVGGAIGAAIFGDDEHPETPSDGGAADPQDDSSSGATESNRDGSA